MSLKYQIDARKKTTTRTLNTIVINTLKRMAAISLRPICSQRMKLTQAQIIYGIYQMITAAFLWFECV